jgi:hypothetical protein
MCIYGKYRVYLTVGRLCMFCTDSFFILGYQVLLATDDWRIGYQVLLATDDWRIGYQVLLATDEHIKNTI